MCFCQNVCLCLPTFFVYVGVISSAHLSDSVSSYIFGRGRYKIRVCSKITVQSKLIKYPYSFTISIVVSVSLPQNKTYVYRGLDYERIGAFNQRLQAQFPDVQVRLLDVIVDEIE